MARDSPFQQQQQQTYQAIAPSVYQPHNAAYAAPTPPHLAAMGRRIAEPGTLQGLANQADIRTRARLGQGLGGVPKNPAQAIPEENRIFPERVLSGELTRCDPSQLKSRSR